MQAYCVKCKAKREKDAITSSDMTKAPIVQLALTYERALQLLLWRQFRESLGHLTTWHSP